ncbi:MAG: hypothetical protein AAB846_02660, partial [Patescibacteria group bacterium]
MDKHSQIQVVDYRETNSKVPNEINVYENVISSSKKKKVPEAIITGGALTESNIETQNSSTLLSKLVGIFPDALLTHPGTGIFIRVDDGRTVIRLY